MADREQTFESVRDELIDFVLENFPSDCTADNLPLNESLLELGIIDSMGVIELVEFLESKWSIRIDESEITHERMGGITKMTNLVLEKIGVLQAGG